MMIFAYFQFFFPNFIFFIMYTIKPISNKIKINNLKKRSV